MDSWKLHNNCFSLFQYCILGLRFQVLPKRQNDEKLID